jgi:hypothetical protein
LHFSTTLLDQKPSTFVDLDSANPKAKLSKKNLKLSINRNYLNNNWNVLQICHVIEPQRML